MTPIPPDAYLLIIGAMKSGTTSLYRYLADHPQICPCRTKEPSFFADIDGKPRPDYPYEQLWQFDPARHRYAMEASTNYTKFPRHGPVAERIHAYGINPKWIYVVRDPFDRIMSHYHYSANSPSQDLRDPFYLDVSRYSSQLRPYTRLFPRENLKIIDFDDLKQRPWQMLLEVTSFLGLENPPRANYAVHNPANRFPPAIRSVLRSPAVKSVRRRLPAGLRQAAKGLLTGPLSRKERRMTPEEREQLYALLKDDMSQFQKDFEFDVSKWGF